MTWPAPSSIFLEDGVDTVAVAFLNAYRNPANELEAAEALRRHGFAGEISLSHQVSGEYREFERTSTTVVDAYVRRVTGGYFQRLTSGLGALGCEATMLMMRSGGGAMTFDDAAERPFETIISGPVAGVEGAAALAAQLELGQVIAADVGGTSFDVSVILDGRPQTLNQGEVMGMPIQAPWVDVRSIGAGGGSIAEIDAGGLLRVGPRSAGAEPGARLLRPRRFRTDGHRRRICARHARGGRVGQWPAAESRARLHGIGRAGRKPCDFRSGGRCGNHAGGRGAHGRRGS